MKPTIHLNNYAGFFYYYLKNDLCQLVNSYFICAFIDIYPLSSRRSPYVSWVTPQMD